MSESAQDSKTDPDDRPRIVATPGTCGGAPRIDGTRIKVQNVLVWHEVMGMSFEDILEGYPHLSLAGIRAALEYCDEHRAEILASLETERLYVERMERESTPHPRLARFRERVNATDDPLSPR